MAEAPRSPLFTAADAWSGGFYEASFLYPPESDLGAALAAFWSFPALAWPVGSRSREPWDQDPVDPAARHRELYGVPGAELEYSDALYGVVSLPGGRRAACATFAHRFEEGPAEVDFSIPLGSLTLAWPEVESFPFGATEAGVGAWEPRLESLLVALAEHVHSRAPFRRVLTGFEGIGLVLDPALEGPGPIPESHSAGVIDVQEDGLVWYPPTLRGGFTFGDDPPPF